MPEIFYHYTTTAGKNAIVRENKIRKSTGEGRRDISLGQGVYLTKLDPSNGKVKVALNNYDGVNPDQYIDWGKVDWYIQVTLDPRKLKAMPGSRDVYCYPEDLEFDSSMSHQVGKVTK